MGRAMKGGMGIRRRLKAFPRDRRGAAGIELALGTVALLSIAGAGFDLYARIDAGTAAARMAASMADYVSAETAPDGAQMDALGAFLRDAELKRPADLVFVVTAIRQAAGDPLPAPTVDWVDTIRFGDADVAAALLAAQWCGSFGAAGAAATLPDSFTGGAGSAPTLAAGELLIAVEVCARLDAEGAMSQRLLDGGLYQGGVYGLHALPARQPHAGPAQPTRAAAPAGGGGGGGSGGGEASGGGEGGSENGGEASGGAGTPGGGGQAPGGTGTPGGGGSEAAGGNAAADAPGGNA